MLSAFSVVRPTSMRRWRTVLDRVAAEVMPHARCRSCGDVLDLAFPRGVRGCCLLSVQAAGVDLPDFLAPLAQVPFAKLVTTSWGLA